ncbi:glycosyltransferase involved in cell wall biosynthesis [Methanomicrobium sp. W14]|uniref:glycosyltransferase n=1 Tax=Methanomicrobium sp. W14 TaxID=2817839 RepID=UPI001AE8AD3F|nr:glycosyltransferase [Methanomicrobium sp. W14]MBP2133103.1 glycosyltransferase involved in cell wall biosynthesis [Methanomicrobium sp. W14]
MNNNSPEDYTLTDIPKLSSLKKDKSPKIAINKKVIIITFGFFQNESIWSVRLCGLAKYLPEFGWDPTIITAQQTKSGQNRLVGQDSYNVVETKYTDITALILSLLGINSGKSIKESLNLKSKKNKKTFCDFCFNLIKEVLYYPDAERGWYKYSLEAGIRLMEENKYEALISSSSPVTGHLVAKNLKMRYNVPWIADLRDLWTQNHYYPYSVFRKIIETSLEKKTLGVADILTTVSEPLSKQLSERYSGKQISVITNGFDPENVNPGVSLSNKFTITYTGQLYKGRRDPELLFVALSELIHEGLLERESVSVDFYGNRESWLEDDIRKYNLSDVVSLHGVVSRETTIKKQWESHILLLLTWDNPLEKGVYTGKVFDYLAARRPILSLGLSGSVVTKLLKETNAGVHCSTVTEIKSYIIEKYTKFKTDGYTSYEGIQSKIDLYNHYEMAKKFAILLDNISSNHRTVDKNIGKSE